MTERFLENSDVLIISIAVLFLGKYLTAKIGVLKTFNIPPAVTGGLICSAVIAAIYTYMNVEITFSMRGRDLLLLVFFSTIGLTSKFSLLKSGGSTLVKLAVVAALFLLIQNSTGVLMAKLMGAHPVYGLFAGTVSFAGGYGTAIAWGNIAEGAGFEGARVIGIACATFGLIAGGLIGGPIARYLIKKHKLDTEKKTGEKNNSPSESSTLYGINVNELFVTLMLIALCVELGDLVNRHLFARGVTVPGFLTAMMTGIIITNLADVMKWKLSNDSINMCSEFSLQLFLSMSLMSIQLWTLADAFGPLLLVLIAQVTAMTLFSVYIIFRVMGKDYDACVIAAGFSGLGLGATPVGIANMNAITTKYGPSPKAFLVIPLVGAFFIDIINALVIKLFLMFPSMTPPG